MSRRKIEKERREREWEQRAKTKGESERRERKSGGDMRERMRPESAEDERL